MTDNKPLSKENEIGDLSNHYGWTARERQRIDGLITKYAKQEAIAFAKFVMHRTNQDMNTESWSYGEQCEILSDDEIYDLYQKEK